jgi:hypothetical protein
MAKMQSYAPKAKTVSIPRPIGKTEGSKTLTNAPTMTQAHIAVKGKNRVGNPSDTSGARGGFAVGTGTKADTRKGL